MTAKLSTIFLVVESIEIESGKQMELRYRLNITGNVRSEIIFGSVKELCVGGAQRWATTPGRYQTKSENPSVGEKVGLICSVEELFDISLSSDYTYFQIP